LNRFILNKWIILFGLLTLTVLLACQQAPTPTPAFSTSVEQFTRDFLDDAEAAGNRYWSIPNNQGLIETKYIELTGEVLAIQRMAQERLIDTQPSDEGGSVKEIETYYTARILLDGFAGIYVQCDLGRRDSKEVFNAIEEGDLITVRVGDPIYHSTQMGRSAFVSVFLCNY